MKYLANTWTPVALGGGRTLARLASSDEETRELDNSVVSTVNTSYSNYDAYGGKTAAEKPGQRGISSKYSKRVNWLCKNKTQETNPCPANPASPCRADPNTSFNAATTANLFDR